MNVESCGADRQQDDREARHRDADSKPCRRDRSLRNGHGRVWNDRDRAHCREMVTANGKRQKQRAGNPPALRVTMQAGGQRSCADQRAEQNGCSNECGIPEDDAADLKRGHAEIMHRGYAAADHSAAEPRTEPPSRQHRYSETCCGQKDCRRKRQGRQCDVVAARNSGRVSQHRDEVRRPDTEAGRDGRNSKPDRTHLLRGMTCVAQQTDRSERGQSTDDSREPHEPQIMGGGDTVVDLEHRTACAREGNDYFGR